MKFLLIICVFIILLGILSLVYIFPNIFNKKKTKTNIKTKKKTKNTKNTKNTKKITNTNTNLDEQLTKSSKDLQEAINRSQNVKKVINQFKKTINENKVNLNYESGIDNESKSGLDSRVNIHANLSNREERDLLGF